MTSQLCVNLEQIIRACVIRLTEVGTLTGRLGVALNSVAGPDPKSGAVAFSLRAVYSLKTRRLKYATLSVEIPRLRSSKLPTRM